MARLVTELQAGDELEFEGVRIVMQAKSGRRARLVLESTGLQEKRGQDNVPPKKPYGLHLPAQ